MSKYDDFDLDLTNTKGEDDPLIVMAATNDYKCDPRPTRIYTICICEV